MTDLAQLDLPALAEGYESRRFSPVEVIEATLAAAERANPVVNAFVLLDHDGALLAARESERRWREGSQKGRLDGAPFTVKDNVLWRGHPIRRGTRTSGTEPAAENAPAVDRLLEAGAVPFGKTTLPEFGWKGIGDSPLTGITRNPWNTGVTTGASSAGAAAAAALGIGPLHIGTDGAGSIRIPCSFSGLFGIKPSFGRVPAFPPSPFAIVSHVGPMTRSVADAAAMLTAIAAPDSRDIAALVTPPPDFSAGLDAGIAGLRVAWSSRLGYVERLDPEVEQLCAAAAAAFAEAGATVEEADPGFPDPTETLRTLWRVGAASILDGIPESRWPELDPGFLQQAEAGLSLTGRDFVAAANARYPLHRGMALFHQRYDLLLTPTLAVPAFAVGHNTPPDGSYGEDWLNWTPYSYPFNLSLQPAATVPCGVTEAGLPVGLQIVGPMGADALVLRAARAFEQIRPWPKIAPLRVRP
ncbi:amidase [Enterovirga sp.]|uniref:amidase n=1 Tax=Enterovirga sp. TaxID=2026350 RepID=UPI002629F0B4|nr:amidase [Enterovirga sp.]MDB5590511.1 amidase [Enterovirga sp.]